MRAPSIKALSNLRKFDGKELDMSDLALIRDAISGCADSWNDYEACVKAKKILNMVDSSILAGFGVESIQNASGDTIAFYVNLGDTYKTTLLYVVNTRSYRVQSWGDFVESYERHHARLP